MSETGELTVKRVGLCSERVTGRCSRAALSLQLPLVPSHSEGASRILITTQKRIGFDPTPRKQTAEVRSTRNKNTLFHVVPTMAGTYDDRALCLVEERMGHGSRATCYPHQGATRNDSRKLATATKHDANNFLAATKSHVLRCLHSGAASLSESRWNSPRVPETGIGENCVTGAKAAAKDLPRRGVLGPRPSDWRTRNTLLQCV
jgi:hypothetical protein